jgi:hypothetical protein
VRDDPSAHHVQVDVHKATVQMLCRRMIAVLLLVSNFDVSAEVKKQDLIHSDFSIREANLQNLIQRS